MAGDVRAGARIVRVIALVIGVPSLAVLAVAPFGPRIPADVWISVVVSLATAWLLLRGSQWARGWIIVALVLGGIGTVVRIAMNLGQLGIVNTVFLGLIGIAYFLGASVLGWSSAVDAYFAREDQGAALNLR